MLFIHWRHHPFEDGFKIKVIHFFFVEQIVYWIILKSSALCMLILFSRIGVLSQFGEGLLIQTAIPQTQYQSNSRSTRKLMQIHIDNHMGIYAKYCKTSVPPQVSNHNAFNTIHQHLQYTRHIDSISFTCTLYRINQEPVF